MGRIVLHLLGSLVLGLMLLGIAELVGRSEARAGIAGHIVIDAQPLAAPVVPARVQKTERLMSDRCWELVGFNTSKSKPSRLNRQHIPLVAPFMPGYLP